MPEPETIPGAAEVWVADDIAQADGSAVASWVGRIHGWSLAQAVGGKRPLYHSASTILNGQAAVMFDGTDDELLYTAADAVSTADTGHVFVVCESDGSLFGAHNQILWCTVNNVPGSHHLYGSFSEPGSGPPASLETAFRDTDAGTFNEVQTTDILDLATGYLLEVSSDGVEWHLHAQNCRIDTTAIVGVNGGQWFGDLSSRDLFCVGALEELGTFTPFHGEIAAVIVIDGVLSNDDRSALNSWAIQKYGLALGCLEWHLDGIYW